MLFDAPLDQATVGPWDPPWDLDVVVYFPRRKDSLGFGKNKEFQAVSRHRNASHSNYLLPMGNRIISIHCFPSVLDGDIDACAQGGAGQNDE
jgi:hypothetical protein